MRLSSTSSSLILATLAVSSSSVALAAPTESNALDEAKVSSSSDLRVVAMAGRSDQMAPGLAHTSRGESSPIHAAQVQALLARGGLLDTLGGALGGIPILGPILVPLFQTFASLASSLGLSLDALQQDAVNAQSAPSLTADQIRMVANAIADAHSQMQAVLAQDGGLHARGRIAEWDAVSDTPPSSSSSSDAVSAPSSSSTGGPMQRSQTAPATPGGATSTSSNSGPTPPVVLPIQPPNTPAMPTLVTPPKATGSVPVIISLASRMIPPVFIKAAQNKVEVSLSDGPATTFTANASSTANSSSTATPTGPQSAALTSAAVANSSSSSTIFPSNSMFARTHTT